MTDIIGKITSLSGRRTRLPDDPLSQALVAAIMVVVARSDGGISPDENLRMVQLLQERFGLSSVDALKLITRVTDTVAQDTDLDQLIATVNRDLSLAAKEELILMILSVIVADKEKDAGEMQVLTTLISDLDIPDDVMHRVYAHYFETRRKGSKI